MMNRSVTPMRALPCASQTMRCECTHNALLCTCALSTHHSGVPIHRPLTQCSTRTLCRIPLHRRTCRVALTAHSPQVASRVIHWVVYVVDFSSASNAPCTLNGARVVIPFEYDPFGFDPIGRQLASSVTRRPRHFLGFVSRSFIDDALDVMASCRSANGPARFMASMVWPCTDLYRQPRTTLDR